MNFRPHLQFYRTIFPFIGAFSLLGSIAFGVFYGFIFFATIGLLFGYWAFNALFKEQWFTYQNLGLTRWTMLKSSFFINLFIGIPVYLLLFILISLIIGDFSLT